MSTSDMVWAVGVVVLAVVFSWFQYRGKTQRMRVFAHRRGWRFTAVDRSLARRYDGTPFGKGSGRRASFVVTGEHRGTRFVAFEYRYTDCDDSTTFTVVLTDLPASRPRLEVTRRTGRSRRGLQLESEQFNDTFRIDTDNDRFAYDVLSPPTMEWLLANWQAPFRFGGDHLLTWQHGSINPDRAMTTVEYVCDLRDRVPSFVWRAA